MEQSSEEVNLGGKSRIISHYKELKLQAYESSKNLRYQYRKEVKSRPTMLSYLNAKDNTFSLTILEPKAKHKS